MTILNTTPTSAAIPVVPRTTTTQEVLSPALLERYSKLIYDVTGVKISQQKQAMLSNRLRKRLKATGLPDFEAYLVHLKNLKPNEPEWDEFLQEVTTHETYLFRDEQQWTWFEKEYLPRIVGEARAKKRLQTLRLWSAACSTGDEAYTAATCLAAAIPMLSQWQIKILGTDIGIGAVRKAQNPHFCPRAMRLVPAELKQRHFTALPDGDCRPKSTLSGLVEFKQHNLLDPLPLPPFDIVILKNVLIYFDEASKRKVIANIRNKIVPGGLLVAGVAEGISDLVKDLKRHQPWLYEMPK